MSHFFCRRSIERVMTRSSWPEFVVTAVLILASDIAFAQSRPETSLRYKVMYQCGGERVQVDHCRHDDDGPGYQPTTPERDYCLVYYPDRPQRGGFMVQAAELRNDVVRKLQACGALAGGQSANVRSGEPASTHALLAEGEKYRDAHDYQRAIETYKKVIVSNPSSADAVEANYEIGYCYVELDQYKEALPYLDTSLRIQPGADANLALGRAYYGLKQYPEAIAALKESIHIDPAFATPFYYLGMAYYDQGHKDLALAAFKQGVALKPKDAFLVEMLGLGFELTKQYDDALQEFQTALSLTADPDTKAIAYLDIGTVEIATKDYRAAVTSLSEALQLNPKDAETNLELGEAFLFQGVNGRAISLFQQAIHLQPDYVEAYYYLGLAYDMMGDKQAAMQVYEKLKSIDSQAAQDLYAEIQKPK